MDKRLSLDSNLAIIFLLILKSGVGSSIFKHCKNGWVAKTSLDQFPPSFLDNCGANIVVLEINFNKGSLERQ